MYFNMYTYDGRKMDGNTIAFSLWSPELGACTEWCRPRTA